VGAFVRSRAWVIPIAIAFALATIAIIPQTTIWRTTYSGSSPAAALADLSAGIGLMAAGSMLYVSDLRPRAGQTAVLAGIAWLAADWAGWQDGLVLPRTLAMGVALYYLPLILHTVARLQRDPAPAVIGRAVPAGYALASALAIVLLLFRDPRTDLDCWSNCTDDALLIGDQPFVAGLLAAAIPAFELVAGAVIALVCILWIARGTPTERRLAAVVAIPALLVGIGGAAHGLALLADPHEGPRFALHDALFQVRAWSAALLAAGLAWLVVRAARSRSAVIRLAAELGDTPEAGTVGPALAAAAGDDSLEVLYRLPHSRAYVDGSGKRRSLPALDDRRAATPIVDSGRVIGVAIHDPSVIDSISLGRLLGPTAILALDNERLRAELLAKLDEVQASRARIVAAADVARAHLERDLHDGAQQGLLAVAYELRRAYGAAGAHVDEEAARAIGAAVQEAEAVLAELRDIAHGIHPAILENKGLGPALLSLADRAPIPVEIRGAAMERLPVVAERTAYAVVARAIDAATMAHAEELVVHMSRTGDRLNLEIHGLQDDTTSEIADRVGAAGGMLDWRGSTLRVWIPCV
jgi:signal transduction histidine kinase